MKKLIIALLSIATTMSIIATRITQYALELGGFREVNPVMADVFAAGINPYFVTIPVFSAFWALMYVSYTRVSKLLALVLSAIIAITCAIDCISDIITVLF